MGLIKSFCIAFSTYSKIPMPQFEWKEKDMQFALCFFPWVGAVIGGLEWLWFLLCSRIQPGAICFVTVAAVIPLLVTGGFHMDGYLDTCDALHSYRPQEEKLRILKDPHIGSFAAIMLAVYLLLELGALSLLTDGKMVLIFCGGFVLSRLYSAWMVIHLKAAKRDGLLVTFANASARKAVTVALVLEALATAAFLFWVSPWGAGVELLTVTLFAIYYQWKMKKEFGGITGDTAGYFVTVCELLTVISMAVLGVITA